MSPSTASTARPRFAAMGAAALAVALLGACATTAPAPRTPVSPAPATATGEGAQPTTTSYPTPAPAPDPAPEPTPEPDDTGQPCPPSPCGDDCSNQPFVRTNCWTTEYGPARADIFVADTNFLYCDGGTYALCFFSGPPYPTGKPRERGENRALPCRLEGNGLANCTCQVYTSGPYFVDINAILNLNAWYETTAACNADGSGCKNLHDCGKDGKRPECRRLQPAPVCQYIQNQNASDPSVSLIPSADVISAFSFAMDDDYRVGSSSCESGEYAGCMTAPCYFQEGATIPPQDGDPIQCVCPTWTGEFQIGQRDRERECKIGGGHLYVWSAANKVKAD